jgi:hypothetical protein
MCGFTEVTTCRECRLVLTDNEIKYYEDRCEDCERDWLERIEDWRHGGEDKGLDELYSAPKQTEH